MNYHDTIQYLYNSTPVFEHVGASAYKEGLSNTLALDEHFDEQTNSYFDSYIDYIDYTD